VHESAGSTWRLDTAVAPLPGGGDLDISYRIIPPDIRSRRAAVSVFHEHRRGLLRAAPPVVSWGLGFMAFVTKSYRTDPTHRPKFRRMSSAGSDAVSGR
jgi:hypothetical protein